MISQIIYKLPVFFSSNNAWYCRLRQALPLFFALVLFCPPVEAKYGGGSGMAEDPYLIYTAEQLNNIGTEPNDWDKQFKLMADIDLSAFAGVDFNIIGYWRSWDDNKPFTGTFDGNGYCLLNFAYRSTEKDAIGLFSYVRKMSHLPAIKDLCLVDPNVDAGEGDNVGALVGILFDGTISSCYVEGGKIFGAESVGGLIGTSVRASFPKEVIIDNCYTMCSVSGTTGIGGVIGCLHEDSKIYNCHSTGDVRGDAAVGGLVGSGFYADVSNCYSTASVFGNRRTGGLIGVGHSFGPGMSIGRSVALGSVSGGEETGGLVGANINGTIVNSYSLALVSGTSKVGGLIGVNQGTVSTCYSAGYIEGTANVGGLVGDVSTNATVTDSFWDIEASGQTTSAGGTGKTTGQMKQKTTYVDWDFNEVWGIAENQTYPFLRRCPPGDINGDCKVDIDDLMILMDHWLQDYTPQD